MFLLLASGSHAPAGEKDPGALRVRPEIRFLSSYAVNYDTMEELGSPHTDTFLWTRFRLITEGQPADWIGFELHASQDFTYSTFGLVDPPSVKEYLQGRNVHLPYGPLCGLVPTFPPDLTMRPFFRSQGLYRVTPGRWLWDDAWNLQAGLGLERLNLFFDLESFRVRVGRQAIDFAGGWLWNPLDLFEPFDPRNFDRDHRYGVDALRMDMFFGEGLGFTVIGALGAGEGNVEEPVEHGVSLYGSAAVGRFFGQGESWSFAVQGGLVHGGYQAGGEAEGRFGPFLLKAQGAYFFAGENDMLTDHFSGVAGMGFVTGGGFEGRLEYRYDGGGYEDIEWQWVKRAICGRSLQHSEHMLGLHLGWEAMENLTASLLVLVEIPDSAWLQPAVHYKASDFLEFTVGAMIPVGGRAGILLSPADGYDPGSYVYGIFEPQSELGTYPTFLFLELKLRS